MHRILKVLTSKLDHNTRTTILMRVDSLMRGVRYEEEQNTQLYQDAKRARWTVDRIETICCLNAFYQVVLGPLAAATRSHLRVGLVRIIPIQYGDKVRVTNTDAASIRQCHHQFRMITKQLRIDLGCLQSPHSKDLLYHLAHRSTKHD